MKVFTSRYFFSLKWATLNPDNLSAKKFHVVKNILNGKATEYAKTIPVVDPLNGETFLKVSTPEGK